MSWSVIDLTVMREALELAAHGRTSPNPRVGCIVVRDGQVVGRGYHHGPGGPHAEVLALREARGQASGATVYVNLEPCDHQARTPPCTEALIEAGVREVVVAMEDPDERVSGRGVRRLRMAGIPVRVGCLEQAARELNADYIHQRTTGAPLVTLKWAMTLDGKVAAGHGRRTEISGPLGRHVAQRLRDEHDAVLVGVGTVVADDPRLTCRIEGGRDPKRIVLDSTLRTPDSAALLSPELAPATLFICTEAATPARIGHFRALGASVRIYPGPRPALAAVLRDLGGEGVLSLLVEGGPTVHAGFLEAGLAQRLVVTVAPSLLGGAQAPGPVAGSGLAALPVPVTSVSTEVHGGEIVLRATIGTRRAEPAAGSEVVR